MSNRIPMVLSKHRFKQVLVGWSLFFSVAANADTTTYLAISDFPVIDAGEVPFYRDQARQALAVNAAVVDYRDRFAKAEVVFDGQPGIYQFTLVAIAENDGEADYRLSVNGEVVAEASNPEVDEDFLVVRHSFGELSLSAGAIIGVESLANSNEKIPENGEFAFARGRWTAVELSTSDVIESANPDLSITGGFSAQDLRAGDTVDVSVSVSNAANSEVATGVVLTMSLPGESLQLVDQSVCSSTQAGVQCLLAEVPAGESVDLSVSFRTIAALSESPVVLRVAADQNDMNESDNSVELLLSVSENPGVESTENLPPETVVDENITESESDESGGDLTDKDTNLTNPLPETTAVSTSSDSRGGGALSLFSLSGFAVCLIFRRRKAAQAV
ncbi:MAG: hypothetical protein AB8B64_11325 [Granulosicoccus sp.]